MMAALIAIFLALLSFIEIADAIIDQETLFYVDLRIQRWTEELIIPKMTRLMVDLTNLAGVYAIVITVLIKYN